MMMSLVLLSTAVYGGKKSEEIAKEKKVQTLKISKVLPFSADKVWKVVGEDYGKIADSHPRIVYSEYLGGSLKGAVGVERLCNFNEKGTQYLYEKIASYDAENYTLVNTVFKAGKFPVDPSLTIATYKVIPIDGMSCEFVFDMQFRTKPAMMGGMMKGSFKKLLSDYFIAIEYHLTTGEKVSKANFKQIKKDSKS